MAWTDQLLAIPSNTDFLNNKISLQNFEQTFIVTTQNKTLLWAKTRLFKIIDLDLQYFSIHLN
jgi:hypothetical protein